MRPNWREVLLTIGGMMCIMSAPWWAALPALVALIACWNYDITLTITPAQRG